MLKRCSWETILSNIASDLFWFVFKVKCLVFFLFSFIGLSSPHRFFDIFHFIPRKRHCFCGDTNRFITITDLCGMKCFVKDCFIHIVLHIPATIFDVLRAYNKFIWSFGITKNVIISTQSNIFVNMKLGRNQITNQLLTLWVQIIKKFQHLEVESAAR